MQILKFIKKRYSFSKENFKHVNMNLIDPNHNIDRDEMSEKFKKSDLIIYACYTQEELEYILNLTTKTVKIGKDRCDDDILELHLGEKFKQKLVIITPFKYIFKKSKWPNKRKPQIFNLYNDEKLIEYIIKHSVTKLSDNTNILNKLVLKIFEKKLFYKWKIQNYRKKFFK